MPTPDPATASPLDDPALIKVDGTLAEVTGTVSFGKDTKGKQRLVITDLDGIAHEYLIPKDKHVTAHDGQVVNKG